ncbi:MAG: PhoU domain-containing protein, partial [Burkholderiales bacterium]
MHEHTSKQFDTDIEAIRTAVLNMGGLVEQQLLRAINALKSDDGEVEQDVLADEERINNMQVEIDRLCNQIISKRQP